MQISPNLDLSSRKCADGHLQLQTLMYTGHKGTTSCVSIPVANPNSCSSQAGAYTGRDSSDPHQAPFQKRTEAGWQGMRQQFAQLLFNLCLCCDWIYALRSTESNSQPFFKKCVILESIYCTTKPVTGCVCWNSESFLKSTPKPSHLSPNG